MVGKSRVMIALFLVLTLVVCGYALTPREEKQIIKDITEIKATLKVFMEEVDRRFEQINNELNRLADALKREGLL